MRSLTTGVVALWVLAACAVRGPQVPYPAFVQADELPDVFLAALPGVRAKQFVGDPQTRRTSNRIVLPANWTGSSGAATGKTLELFVLAGEMRIGDLILRPGGYAWFPPGFAGANLSTDYGTELLYFLDEPVPGAIIGTPIIYSAEIVDWQPLPGGAESGLSVKELRRDPGNGARTWLLRATPEARMPWQQRPRVLEGYLVSGRYLATECVNGKPVSGEYTEGGYFHRPADSVHGGPKERAVETAVWLLRTRGDAEPVTVADCAPPAKPG